jgi:GT2 family glycosyltransferase
VQSVSVYIPAKDAEHTLREVLPAVVSQTYPIVEIVVVDDGSINPYEFELTHATIPIRVVRHPRNLGIAAARNTALKETSCELIVSFDADIVPEPHCVEKLVDAITRDSTLGGAGGRVTERHTDTVGDLFRAHFMRQDRGEEPLENVDLFGGCTMYRRAVLVEVGGYTETLRRSFEDFDVSHRVRARGWKTAYVPSARAEHIKRDTIISAVDTLYHWSYPHWESDEVLAKHNWLAERIDPPINYYESAVSVRIQTLDLKLHKDMSLARERIQRCDNVRLLYPLILYPVRALLRDVITYRTCGGPESEQVIEICTNMLVHIFQKALKPPLAAKIEVDIKDLMDSVCDKPTWQTRWETMSQTNKDLVSLAEAGSEAALPARTFLEAYSEILCIYSERFSGL